MTSFAVVGEAKALRERVGEAEWEARADLAAAYRLVAHFGWTDTIYNHISLRVPGTHDHFLINPFGLLYEEMRASNLVKITIDGDIIEDPLELGINRAGFVIHGALHAARTDVACVLHTHSVAGMAVAAQADGLLALSQHAATIYDHVAYHDFEGVALDLDEQKRLVADLGDKRIMILRNHGLLTAGRTIGEAVQLMFMTERACAAQIAALTSATRDIPSAIVRKSSALMAHHEDYSRDWAALKRIALRLDPTFAT